MDGASTAWNNQGTYWFGGAGGETRNFGQAVYRYAGTYTVNANTLPAINGYKYSFDRWEKSGAVSLTDTYWFNTDTNVSGDCSLTAVFIKDDFRIDIANPSAEIVAGNTATYNVTVTRLAFPHGGSGYDFASELTGLPANIASTSLPSLYLGKDTLQASSTFGISTTTQTPPGTYAVTLRLEIAGGYPSSYHTQSVSLKVNPVPVYKPNLVIEDFWWTPDNPSPGSPVSFTYIERNIGQGSASGHRNTLWIDSEVIASEDIPDTLAGGAYRTLTFGQQWEATPGTHTARIKADTGGTGPAGGIQEDNEEDNYRDETISGINRFASAIAIALEPSSIPDNTSVRLTISGRLTDVTTGAGLARTISLSSSAGINTTVDTNANGYYSYIGPSAHLSSGIYPITATFGGDSNYQSSSQAASLAVNTPPPRLDVSVSVTSPRGDGILVAYQPGNKLVVTVRDERAAPVSDATVTLSCYYIGKSRAFTDFTLEEAGKYVLDISRSDTEFDVGTIDFDIKVTRGSLEKTVTLEVSFIDGTARFTLPPKGWWLRPDTVISVVAGGYQYFAYLMVNQTLGYSWLVLDDTGHLPDETTYSNACQAATISYFFKSIRDDPAQLDDMAKAYEDIIWANNFADIAVFVRNASAATFGSLVLGTVSGGTSIMTTAARVFATNFVDEIMGGQSPAQTERLVRLTSMATLSKSARELRTAADIARQQQWQIWSFENAQVFFDNLRSGLVYGLTYVNVLDATLPSGEALNQLLEIGMSVIGVESIQYVYDAITTAGNVPNLLAAFESGQPYEDKFASIAESWGNYASEVMPYARTATGSPYWTSVIPCKYRCSPWVRGRLPSAPPPARMVNMPTVLKLY